MNDDLAILKSAINKDAPAPVDAIERVGTERTYALLSAAVSVAVPRKFSLDDLGAIKRFAEGLPERFPAGADEIKPINAELVMRASLGDADAIEPLSHDEILGMCWLLTYAIIALENLDDAGQQEYFKEVLAVANED